MKGICLGFKSKIFILIFSLAMVYAPAALANSTPTISDIGDQATNEDTPTSAISFTVGDAESAPEDLSVTASSSNRELVPEGNIEFGGSGTDRTMTIRPAPDQFGTAVITVTVSDGTASASDTFTLTVNAVNDPPTLAPLANLMINEDAGAQTVNLTGITSGAPNEYDSLDVTLSLSNTAVISILSLSYTSPNPTGSFSFEPKRDVYGTVTVTVTVSETKNRSNYCAQTFTVNVVRVNDPPSFNKGADQVVSEDAGPQTVTGWAKNISVGPVNEQAYEHQSVDFIITNDHPALFAVQPAVSPDGTLTYTSAHDANGMATVTVKAHDDGGAANGGVDTSLAQTFTITITPVNDAPVISGVYDQEMDEDSIKTIPVALSDKETAAEELIVTASSSNPPLVPEENILIERAENAWTVTIKPAADQYGETAITLTVSDGELTAVDSFTLRVNPVNDAPTFVKGGDQTVLEDAGSQYVQGWLQNISAGPANEAGQRLTLKVTNDNPELFSVQPAIDLATGDLTYTPADNGNGAATVTVRLSDDGGSTGGGRDTTLQTLLITVTPVNDMPSFTKGADQESWEDAGAQMVTGWATQICAGPENEAGQELIFVLTNDRPDLFAVQPAIDPFTGNLTYTPAHHASGRANIVVTLRDNGGTDHGGIDTSTAQSFVINVRPRHRDSAALLRDSVEFVNVDGRVEQLNFLYTDEKTLVAITNTNAETAEAVLSWETCDRLLKKDARAVFRLKTARASSDLPLAELKTAAAAYGSGVKAKDIRLTVSIGNTREETIKTAEQKAREFGAKILVPPVDFRAYITNADGRVKEVYGFATYVLRTLELPGAVDAATAVGVCYDAAMNTYTPVPTIFETRDSKTIDRMLQRENGTYTVLGFHKTFADMSDHWAKNDTELLAAKLIVNGKDGRTFDPDSGITRAEFFAMLVRALGIPIKHGGAGFTDTPGGWYADLVNTAADAGLVKGYGDGSFRPGAKITREEIAVILSRVIKYTSVSSGAADVEHSLARFNDWAKIAGWAREEAADAAQAGIVKGDAQGNFNPDSNCTRAEAAVMLKRLLEFVHFIN